MGFSKQELIEIMREIRKLDAAQILEAEDMTRFNVQRFPIDLSNARSEADPYIIGFPFKTLWFKNANSGTAKIRVKLNKNESGQSYAEFGDNDIIKSSKMYSNAFLFWDAQSGVNIEAYVFTDSEVSSGALKASNNVSIAPAATISTPQQRVADNTGNIFIPANPAAKSVLIENTSAVDIKFGGLGTTHNSSATDGITLPSGSSTQLDCSGNIYLVTGGAGTANIQFVYLV